MPSYLMTNDELQTAIEFAASREQNPPWPEHLEALLKLQRMRGAFGAISTEHHKMDLHKALNELAWMKKLQDDKEV